MRTLTMIRFFAGALTVIGTVALAGCGGDASTTGKGGAGGAETGGGGGQGGSGSCSDGATQSCYSGPNGTMGIGACVGGTQTCTGGQWGACSGEVIPGAETCNGADDDCNGQTDENIAQITCGKGICQVTVEGCNGGMVPTCTPLDPMPVELCNGIDDNCDGTLDEGCSCTDGSTQQCFSGNPTNKDVGECKSGTQTCAGGQWGTCDGEVLPVMETCDNLDNDCNSQNDDNIADITCGVSACANKVAACVNGVPQICTPGQPKPEVCNNIDDDCDLFVDNGLGTISCGLGACQVTVSACAGGQPQTCVAGMPTTEMCDGIDNNCDGVVDDNNPGGGAACVSGQLGVCSSGTLTCTMGMLKCLANQMPAAESCDGLDNNCNGATDEGNPGGGGMCNVVGKLGPCAQGSLNCQNGTLSCSQTTFPTPELCNGSDDNCNGTVDEGNPESGGACTTMLPGVCSAGTFQCTNGALACTQSQPSSAEICDNKDNNCNGTTDEGNPQGGMPCNVVGLLGECAKGLTACMNGAIVCTQVNFATAEVCDGLDNNCNGVVDNGNPGGGTSCSTGQLGVCAAGTTACTAGAIVCNRNVNPSNETCDNLDNNCNGTVDEGNPGGGATCMNPLGCSGTSACQAGTLNCIVPNNPEICDGIDNNCNGLIDEGAGTVTNIFTDEFANNTKGWTLGLTWAIGPTVAGPLPPFGNSDPALDHTATANNGVAGVVLGGNYNATNVTPAYYITSPNINTSGTGFVTLDFWRWLNTDWPEYVAATIDVSANGGTTWTNIWIQPTGGTLEDTAWTQINHNLSAYKSTTMRIRFGYQVLQNEVAGAFVMSGWNVDDVLVRRCQ